MALDRIKYLNKFKDIQNQIDTVASGYKTLKINQNADAEYKICQGIFNRLIKYIFKSNKKVT